MVKEPKTAPIASGTGVSVRALSDGRVEFEIHVSSQSPSVRTKSRLRPDDAEKLAQDLLEAAVGARTGKRLPEPS